MKIAKSEYCEMRNLWYCEIDCRAHFKHKPSLNILKNGRDHKWGIDSVKPKRPQNGGTETLSRTVVIE